jgi:Flp pilus assembly protein TadD/uncharacterized protein (AIM24 family)
MTAGNDDGTPPQRGQDVRGVPQIDRRLRNSARPPSMTPPSDATRDAANEDFLFHLYRGSELLQDNRVHEAKTELEFALGLQPRDPKGQDLLALVYFRIGLYPHAIQIYEGLLRELPDEPSLKLNLALCYLKTGQAQLARTELEEVVAVHADHRRAWGYLGLAYQRTGEFLKAQHAFEKGGHAAMSKRMSDRNITVPPPGPPKDLPPRRSPSPEEPEPDQDRDGAEMIRAAAAVAFEELDSGILSFALAEPERPKSAGESGTWHAVEPGAAFPSPSRQAATEARPRPRRRDTLEWGFRVLDVKAEPPKDETALRDESPAAPRPVSELTRDALLQFPEGSAVAMLRSGLALVRTHAGGRESDFAVRLEAVRSYSGAITTGVLQRQTRGQITQETFGGMGAPMASVSGDAELVLGPRPGHRIVGFALKDDFAFVREELLLGFEMRLPFENGRLAVGEGDFASLVQLHGTGSVLIELMDPLASLEVTASRSVHIRREVLVGWVGRLVPRELPFAEAPLGQRGLLSFSGEGVILLLAR